MNNNFVFLEEYKSIFELLSVAEGLINVFVSPDVLVKYNFAKDLVIKKLSRLEQERREFSFGVGDYNRQELDQKLMQVQEECERQTNNCSILSSQIEVLSAENKKLIHELSSSKNSLMTPSLEQKMKTLQDRCTLGEQAVTEAASLRVRLKEVERERNVFQKENLSLKDQLFVVNERVEKLEKENRQQKEQFDSDTEERKKRIEKLHSEFKGLQERAKKTLSQEKERYTKILSQLNPLYLYFQSLQSNTEEKQGDTLLETENDLDEFVLFLEGVIKDKEKMRGIVANEQHTQVISDYNRSTEKIREILSRISENR